MKLILVATMWAGSATLIDAWQINYYKTSDCSGTAKVTQGEGQACLQGPDAYRFLSLVDGSAIMASDDQCQQQGGFEYNRGECNSFLLPYISINGGSGVSADVIYTGYCSGGNGTPSDPGICMWTDDSGAPIESTCNPYDPCPSEGTNCFHSTVTGGTVCSGRAPPGGGGTAE